VLSAGLEINETLGSDDEADCKFESTAPLQTTVADVFCDAQESTTVPVGDIDVTTPNTDVDLTCSASSSNGDNVFAGDASALFATQVSALTPSN
jgi:hypothetical protein